MNKITQRTSSFFQRNGLILKGLLVGFLIILMMWPASHIRSLIYERQARQNQVITEVSNQWSQKQTFTGPILNIPFYTYTVSENADGVKQTVKSAKQYRRVLPDLLNINGQVATEERKRGIYKVAVYNSDLKVDGSFSLPENWLAEGDEILYDEAFVTVGISDMRGIQGNTDLTWAGEKITSEPGVKEKGVISSGIHYPISVMPEETKQNIPYSLDLSLKGSQNLSFVPVGKETAVSLQSAWPDPSFQGAFSPEHDIDKNGGGFTADWNVLHLNRNFPQEWNNGAFKLNSSKFGFDLLIPADHYQMSERSVKYALLFISLTFMVFFFIEILNNRYVHPFQYILIGLALCIFYTLLLSISEQLGFTPAYFISSAMTIGLIAFYSRAILKSPQLSLMLEGILVVLYGFIFVILQMEDYSLLIGSLGVFFILALVMYFSRKIDWYAIGHLRSKPQEIELAQP